MPARCQSTCPHTCPGAKARPRIAAQLTGCEGACAPGRQIAHPPECQSARSRGCQPAPQSARPGARPFARPFAPARPQARTAGCRPGRTPDCSTADTVFARLTRNAFRTAAKKDRICFTQIRSFCPTVSDPGVWLAHRIRCQCEPGRPLPRLRPGPPPGASGAIPAFSMPHRPQVVRVAKAQAQGATGQPPVQKSYNTANAAPVSAPQRRTDAAKCGQTQRIPPCKPAAQTYQ